MSFFLSGNFWQSQRASWLIFVPWPQATIHCLHIKTKVQKEVVGISALVQHATSVLLHCSSVKISALHSCYLHHPWPLSFLPSSFSFFYSHYSSSSCLDLFQYSTPNFFYFHVENNLSWSIPRLQSFYYLPDLLLYLMVLLLRSANTAEKQNKLIATRSF